MSYQNPPTTPRTSATFDEYTLSEIRRAAITHRVPCITTIAGAAAAVNGIRAIRREDLSVRSIQEYHS